MILGFTGTRRGVTGPQYVTLSNLIESLVMERGGIEEAHHGDCSGADAEFHAVIRRVAPLTKIVVHPPTDSFLRAYCQGDITLPELPYLMRNADIVAACDRLIAVPNESTEQQRGGTWSTVRKARKAGKPITVIRPDGSVGEEN